MFYKDKAGIQVCQLGTGDVSVGNIEWQDVPDNECVGIVFGETDKGAIDRRLKHIEGKLDCNARVKLKLLFTKVESIDVIIEKLKIAKNLMLEES
jgi:hypothetical protein